MDPQALVQGPPLPLLHTRALCQGSWPACLLRAAPSHPTLTDGATLQLTPWGGPQMLAYPSSLRSRALPLPSWAGRQGTGGTLIPTLLHTHLP